MGERTSSSLSELHIVLLLGRAAIRNKTLHKLKLYHFTDKLTKYIYATIRKLDSYQEDIAWQTLSAAVQTHFRNNPDKIKIFTPLASFYNNILNTPRSQLSQYITEISRYILYREVHSILDKLTNTTWDQVNPEYFVSKLSSLATKVELSTLDPVPMDKLALLKRYSEIEEDESSKILSSIPQINQNLLYSGYKPSDLVMVMASPGTGKTTFMMQEATAFISQGIGVAYFFLGDMSPHSISLRFLTQINNMTTGDWASHVRITDSSLEHKIDQYKLTYSPINRLVLESDFYTRVADTYSEILDEYLKIYCIPAVTITIDELISEYLTCQINNPNIKVLIVDYDLNLSKKMDSMYEEGSYSYAKLSALADDGNLVLVATQTKTQYWDSLLPPLHAASESSRKQHAIDIAISIGRLGHLYMCKVREGIEGAIVECNKDLAHSCFLPRREVTREEVIQMARQRGG